MSVIPQLERDLLELARQRLPAELSGAQSRQGARRSAGPARRLAFGPLLAAISVAVAIGVGVIAVGSLRHGRARSPALLSRPPLAPYAAVSGLLAGLPQSGTRLGAPGAPVRVTLYGDLECPQCRRLVWSRAFAQFVAGDVGGRRASITYTSLCTTTCVYRGQRRFGVQQAAAYAAGQQDLFWQYALLFYLEQGNARTGYVTARYLTGLADQLPELNLRRWEAERRSARLLARIRAEQSATGRMHVLGTPTLSFRGGRAVVSLATADPSVLLARAVRAAEHGCPPRWRSVGFTHCRDLV